MILPMGQVLRDRNFAVFGPRGLVGIVYCSVLRKGTGTVQVVPLVLKAIDISDPEDADRGVVHTF